VLSIEKNSPFFAPEQQNRPQQELQPVNLATSSLPSVSSLISALNAAPLPQSLTEVPTTLETESLAPTLRELAISLSNQPEPTVTPVASQLELAPEPYVLADYRFEGTTPTTVNGLNMESLGIVELDPQIGSFRFPAVDAAELSRAA